MNKSYTMTEIAKELNLKSAIELNKMLSLNRNRSYNEIKSRVFSYFRGRRNFAPHNLKISTILTKPK